LVLEYLEKGILGYGVSIGNIGGDWSSAGG